MNAYATIEFLSNTTNNNRVVRRALVEMSDTNGNWIGSFTAFGLTSEQTKDVAYIEANINLSRKGYTLQSLRVAA